MSFHEITIRLSDSAFSELKRSAASGGLSPVDFALQRLSAGASEVTQMASTHNSIKKPASQDQTNVLPQFRSIVSVSSKDTDNSVDERAQAEYFKYLTTKHS